MSTRVFSKSASLLSPGDVAVGTCLAPLVAQVSDLLYRRTPACKAQINPMVEVSADAMQIRNLRYSSPGGLRYPFGQIFRKALNTHGRRRSIGGRSDSKRQLAATGAPAGSGS